MKYLYLLILFSVGFFSVAQAVQYVPPVYINGRPATTPCQSVGDDGKIIYEICRFVGPWIHPNAVWPRVTNIPIDQTHKNDLIRQATLKKANDAKDLVMTKKMEDVMRNLVRWGSGIAAPKIVPKTVPQSQASEPSESGNTGQSNSVILISRCERIQNALACITNRTSRCRWGGGSCSDF